MLFNSKDEFNRYESERKGNITKWKIVWNERSSRYFIYRIVPNPNNLRKKEHPYVSQYLERDGKINNSGGNSWYEDYGEISTAFALHAHYIKNGTVRMLVEENYWNWLESQNATYDNLHKEN